MAWPRHQILHHPPPPPPPPPPPHSPAARISPALLVIIVVLAVLFFISGLLHLLVRLLTKNPSSSSNNRPHSSPEASTADALQRQLQQLFNLHDSGLDQAFIDSLPVFLYKEIVGPKEPFDCAVCLSEFSQKDKLRLLPTCSHAFHINCIDTWLLSNSTCPLCRGTLFAPGFSMENPAFEFDELPENGVSCSEQKTAESEEGKGDRKGVVPVMLGKFRKPDGEMGEALPGEASNSYLDARRCYSMGSYEYVLGNTNLRVTLCPDQRDRSKKVLNGAEDLEGKRISSVSRRDSYSVSKTWLWKKKGAFSSSPDAPSQIDLPPLSTEFSAMDRARIE